MFNWPDAFHGLLAGGAVSVLAGGAVSVLALVFGWVWRKS